jgi:hypothetical protein
VPRATRRPRDRVDVLPSSSGKASVIVMTEGQNLCRRIHTASDLFHVVENEVHQLVVAFERAGDYKNIIVSF